MRSLYLLLWIVVGGCVPISQARASDSTPSFTLPKQFRVDTISWSQGISITSRLFADNGHFREETNVGGLPFVTILNPDLGKLYTVWPLRKRVVEGAYDEHTKGVFGYLRTASGMEGALNLVGPDQVGNVACMKYKITTQDNKIFFIWVDSTKQIPVRVTTENGNMDQLWKNFKTGPQDTMLFIPPADYQVVTLTVPPGAP